MRTRWFSKHLSFCTDETGVLCSTIGRKGHTCHGWGDFVIYSLFRALRRFPQRYNAHLMQDVCFLTRDGRLPLTLGADFNFLPSLWQDLSMHGGSLWIRKLGASVFVPEGTTHKCRTGKGQNPDIIGYFLMSTLVRPLIQKSWCSVQTADWKNQQAKPPQYERTPRTEHAPH